MALSRAGDMLSAASATANPKMALCIRRFGAVTALTVLAMALGCWGALRAPLDVFPEFVPSQVDIQTEAPGFAPEQVEELITKQIENVVNGAAGIDTMPRLEAIQEKTHDKP